MLPLTSRYGQDLESNLSRTSKQLKRFLSRNLRPRCFYCPRKDVLSLKDFIELVVRNLVYICLYISLNELVLLPLFQLSVLSLSSSHSLMYNVDSF